MKKKAIKKRFAPNTELQKKLIAKMKKDKLSFRTAAAASGIPRSTIFDVVNGKALYGNNEILLSMWLQAK